MTTRIRLRRMGSNKRPFFRVVVADQRSPRDGRFIENIGKYHPLDDPSVIEIDQERALHWLRVGAQPSNQVRNLMNKIGIWDEFVKERPSAALEPGKERPERSKVSKKAKQKAEAAAAEPIGAPVEEAPAEPQPEPEPEVAEASAAEAVEAVEEAPTDEAPAAEEAPAPEATVVRRGSHRPPRTSPPRTRPLPRKHPPPRNRRRGLVKDLVEFLVQELVDEPDAVSIEETFDERGPRYRVRVAPEDMGKVIGRGGRTAKAIRTVVRAAAQRQGHGAMVDIED